jgi:uncharacterized oxidoreductase
MMKSVTFSVDRWLDIAQRVFAAWGTPPDSARIVARSLVNSDLAGVSGHGLIRVSDYLGYVKSGWLRAEGVPVVKAETPVMTHVDGGYGFGQPAVHFALERTLPKARAMGIAAATIVHGGHVGRLGEYAERAAEEGMVALMASSAAGNTGLVVPYGGAERVFSTNPIAAGVPAGAHAPFIMDFATSVVAAGKLELGPDKDRPIPEGWAVNAEGRPATTVRQFLEGGGLLPFGGHKGYALSVLAELLGSALTGCGVPSDPHKPRGLGFGGNSSFLIVLDIAHFTDPRGFAANVDALFERLEAVRPAPGFERVIIPGTPEREKRLANERQGRLTMDGAIWERIVAVAAERGLTLDAAAEAGGA